MSKILIAYFFRQRRHGPHGEGDGKGRWSGSV